MNNNQPKTYFFINWKLNKTQHRFGPYDSLQNATNIMLNLIPEIIKPVAKRVYYEASIQEECLCENTWQWKTIATPIKENKCIRL